MAPSPTNSLHDLLCKAAYWAQYVSETLGGTPGMAIYANMGASPTDSLQVLAAKLAYWLAAISGGGGSAPAVGLTQAAGAPAVDGSITTLFYRNTSTGQKYMTTGTVAVPAWEAI